MQETEAGAEMSKVEQVFKSADFSGETDLKLRLRAQLFNNTGTFSNGRSSRRGKIRELRFDELDQVTAAGDIHGQQKNVPAEDMSATQGGALGRNRPDQRKPSKPSLDEELKRQWTGPLTGIPVEKDRQ